MATMQPEGRSRSAHAIDTDARREQHHHHDADRLTESARWQTSMPLVDMLTVRTSESVEAKGVPPERSGASIDPARRRGSR